jgi:hypothetical protein
VIVTKATRQILGNAQFAAHNYTAFGKGHFLADLQHPVPARALYRGTDKLRADVTLAEIPLVDRVLDRI